MRIISQDKAADVPYEISVLMIDERTNWYVIAARVYDAQVMLGRYYTLDDARAVLWAIAANAKAKKDYFEMPGEEEDLEYARKV